MFDATPHDLSLTCMRLTCNVRICRMFKGYICQEDILCLSKRSYFPQVECNASVLSSLRCVLCRFQCCMPSCHVREKQNIIRLFTRLILRLISLIGGSRRFPFNIRQLHGPLPVVDSKQIKIESLSFVGATQKPIFHEMHSRLTLASEIKIIIIISGCLTKFRNFPKYQHHV